MDPISLKCGQCGHAFTRAAAGANRRVNCAVCDAEVPFPHVDAEAEGGEAEPRLRILRHGTVGGKSVVCASCRETMGMNDSACPHCGTARAPEVSSPTSEPKEEPRPRPPRVRRARRARTLRPWLVILVLAAAGAAYWRWKGDEPREERPSPTPVEAPDPDVLRAEARERIRQVWDAERPLAEQGDDLELEHQTGRVIRGRLVRRIENRAVDVRTEQGREVVAYHELRSPSRSRVDPDYRAHRIEEQAQREAGFR